jgi:hypothetical protein
MDPISATGLATSLISTVDIIARSVSFLLALQTRYRQADLTVSLLIGQLSTLKAALNQICEWIKTKLVAVPRHEQLVKDLNVSIEGCKVLLLVLDERIVSCERSEDDSLNAMGKARLLWAGSDIDQYLAQLNNHIIALNLLLTALQW